MNKNKLFLALVLLFGYGLLGAMNLAVISKKLVPLYKQQQQQNVNLKRGALSTTTIRSTGSIDAVPTCDCGIQACPEVGSVETNTNTAPTCVDSEVQSCPATDSVKVNTHAMPTRVDSETKTFSDTSSTEMQTDEVPAQYTQIVPFNCSSLAQPLSPDLLAIPQDVIQSRFGCWWTWAKSCVKSMPVILATATACCLVGTYIALG